MPNVNLIKRLFENYYITILKWRGTEIDNSLKFIKTKIISWL
jgi:hypothetical protein